MKSDSIKQAMLYCFPTVLILFQNRGESDSEKPEKLIEFIENENIIEFGKKELEFLSTSIQLENIYKFSEILDIDQNKFKT